MKKFLTDKNLTIINFTIVLYFIVMYVLHMYQVDFVVVGFFKELLTIPFLIAQVVFVFAGIYFLIKHKIRIGTLVSVIALVICAFYTIRSFF